MLQGGVGALIDELGIRAKVTSCDERFSPGAAFCRLMSSSRSTSSRPRPAPAAPTSSISAWAIRILPAPKHVIDKLVETVGKPRTDRYSASKGIAGLRRAQAGYYARRFGVKLDPETQVVATLGSKEGFANMAQAITAPGDVVLVPNPSYPIHAFGFLMAGGVIRSVPAEPGPNSSSRSSARSRIRSRSRSPSWSVIRPTRRRWSPRSTSIGTWCCLRRSTRFSCCPTLPMPKSISKTRRRRRSCRRPARSKSRSSSLRCRRPFRWRAGG